ncbi:hypothetical protein LTR62_004064 [Meristemomyces frigidus]|uniref:CFEM domain-containing protein n=1 Tax=Meristemomyces frigidus TaxID=1508187 RepID=A0AAN7TRD0_9PEZI|nr:hypothetical protein LTR62_004064 [Meristemomyces frigidus]
MRSTLLLLATGLATLTSAQGIPACATDCFAQAVGNTTCSATDNYCQCTTGQATIYEIAIPCLCHSTCSSTDLLNIVVNSNKVCAAALSASGMSYSPATVGLGACAAAATGGASSAATLTRSGSMAAATGSSTGTVKSSATANTSGSSSASASVAMQTASSGAGRKMVYGEAVLGLAGLAVLAL